ncbi:hypothetical protein [Garciella nitratireducens]|uniref:hypothetical protein n=1 Tax=Garciella nitratireducens TaxID=218205 RepID=UPI001BD279D8|nr:hypothetical protein [Garciella nitratireducens]
MDCPVCSKKDIGKIGRNKYFCSNCFSEVSINKNTCNIFQIDENGSLIKIYEKLLKDILVPNSALKEKYNI